MHPMVALEPRGRRDGDAMLTGHFVRRVVAAAFGKHAGTQRHARARAGCGMLSTPRHVFPLRLDMLLRVRRPLARSSARHLRRTDRPRLPRGIPVASASGPRPGALKRKQRPQPYAAPPARPLQLKHVPYGFPPGGDGGNRDGRKRCGWMLWPVQAPRIRRA